MIFNKIVKQTEGLLKKYSLFILCFLIFFSIFVKFTRFQISHLETIKSADIKYTWQDGVSLAKGEKFYNRILDGDLINNQKYPLYWPFVYQLSAFFYFLGGNLSSYAFTTLLLSFLAETAATLFIFKFFVRRKEKLAGLFFCCFWLFNNYNFYVNGTLQLDMIIISLLLISFLTFTGKPQFSAFIYGLSLSIKQSGFLLLPAYIFDQSNFKQKVRRLGLIFLLPLISALPFVFNQPRGFFISMAFSLIRKADRQGGYALGLLGDSGILSRLPFFTVYLGTSLLFIFKKINRFSYAFFTYLTVIFFNPVLFPQYFVYLAPFSFLQLYQKKGK